MVTMDEAFVDWLDGLMPGDQTRREFVKEAGIERSDLKWAFSAGWRLGQRQAFEEQK